MIQLNVEAKMPRELEYLEKLRLFTGEIDKAVISDFDLFQKIFFDVELTRGDKLTRIVSGFEKPVIKVDIKELYQCALTALSIAMPERVFDAYAEVLRRTEVKRAMRTYPKWRREFEKLCLMTEKLKMYGGRRN
jgi:hypothetical protein